MEILANVIGLLAVALYVFSYQLKSRQGIIICNAVSRILYVLQYILLGAFTGAVLDVVAFFVSLLCIGRNTGFIKKHFWLTMILSNAVIIAAGLFTYKNAFSLLAIFGVLFETMAFWLRTEPKIRLVSLLGAPFWLVYNLASMAYGSALGNVITLVSILVAIIRYDILGRKETTK